MTMHDESLHPEEEMVALGCRETVVEGGNRKPDRGVSARSSGHYHTVLTGCTGTVFKRSYKW